MATPNVCLFEEMLPAELHNQIFELVVPCDRVVLMSTKMKNRFEFDTYKAGAKKGQPREWVRYTSRISRAFSSPILRARYQILLRHWVSRACGLAEIINVNVVDFGFSNFMAFYDEWKANDLHEAMHVFRHIGGTESDWTRRHVLGMTNCFNVNLFFTSKFDSSHEQRLLTWLKRGNKIEKTTDGHLRMLYNVKDYAPSPGLESMVKNLLYDDRKREGQEKHIIEALKAAFTRAGQWEDLPLGFDDINRRHRLEYLDGWFEMPNPSTEAPVEVEDEEMSEDGYDYEDSEPQYRIDGLPLVHASTAAASNEEEPTYSNSAVDDDDSDEEMGMDESEGTEKEEDDELPGSLPNMDAAQWQPYTPIVSSADAYGTETDAVDRQVSIKSEPEDDNVYAPFPVAAGGFQPVYAPMVHAASQ